MKKLAAVFAATVMLFTIGACVQGQGAEENTTAVVRNF